MMLPKSRKQRVIFFVVSALALIIGLTLLWGWQTGRISFRAATDKTTLEIANDQIAKIEAITAEIDTYSAELLTALPIYQAGDVKDKDRLAGQMITIAKKRFSLQTQLLSLGSQLSLENSESESNPAIQALGRTAFAADLLPNLIAVPGLPAVMESGVDVEGVITVEIVDGDSFHQTQYALSVNEDNILEVRFGVRPPVLTGDRVRIKAVKVGDAVVVGADSVAQIGQYLTVTTEGPSSSGLDEIANVVDLEDDVIVAPAVSKRVAVVAFNFSNNRIQPVTPAKLRQFVFTGPQSAKVWFSEVSEGKIELTGDVYGYYSPNVLPPSACNSATRLQMTRAAERELARAVGIGDREPLSSLLDHFDYLMFVFPEFTGTNCGYAGAAPVGGNRSYYPVNSSIQTNSTWTRLPVHELGHNFGLEHAGNFDCRDSQKRRIRYDERISCEDVTYGDLDDVMGGLAGSDSFTASTSTRHYSGINLNRLGWLPNQQVQTVASSGTFTLYPSNRTGSGVRLLKLPNAQGGPVYIEYRRPSGLFDNYSAGTTSVNGVLVRRLNPAIPFKTTVLYGGGPHNPTAAYEAAVPLNKTLTLSNSGINIRTVGLADSNARVEVSYFNPNSCVKNRWEQTVTPVTSSITSTSSTSRQYQINLRNTNVGACGSSQVTPTATSVTIGSNDITKTISPVPLTIAPGESASTTLTLTARPGMRGGRYSFTVKTIDPLNPSVTVQSQIDLWVSW